jgi:hypothetical protein
VTNINCKLFGALTTIAMLAPATGAPAASCGTLPQRVTSGSPHRGAPSPHMTHDADPWNSSAATATGPISKETTMNTNLKLKLVGLSTTIAMFALPVADAVARNWS